MNWKLKIATLPPGLSYAQAAKRLRRPYQSTRNAMIRHGYLAVDQRPALRARWTHHANWKLPNATIAKRFGLSRQRVFSARKRLGLSKKI